LDYPANEGKTMSRIAFCIAALSIGHCALADIRIDYELSGQGCVPEQEVIEIQGTRMRIDLAGSSDNTSAIIDGTEALVWSLDHQQHTVMQMEIDADAIDFQTDVGKATATRMDRELDKLDVAQRDAEKQMTEQCARMKRKGQTCPSVAMPNIREMMSPENMARMQQAMAGSGQQGAASMDPAQVQALMGAAGTNTDPAMMSKMQALVSSEDMKKLEERALAKRAKEEGVDVETLRAEDAEARSKMHASALEQLTERREIGPSQVAGIACTRYQLERDGAVVGNECRAPLSAFKLAARDAKGSERNLRIADQYSQAFAPVLKVFGGQPQDEEAIRSRIVLEKICVEHEREVGRATVRIARTPISAERFEVPAGYRPAF
jgi:hypothetical protein